MSGKPLYGSYAMAIWVVVANHVSSVSFRAW